MDGHSLGFRPGNVSLSLNAALLWFASAVDTVWEEQTAGEESSLAPVATGTQRVWRAEVGCTQWWVWCVL